MKPRRESRPARRSAVRVAVALLFALAVWALHLRGAPAPPAPPRRERGGGAALRPPLRRGLTVVSTMRALQPDSAPCSAAHLQRLAVDNWLGFADEVVLLVDDAASCTALGGGGAAAALRRRRGLRCVPHACRDADFDRPTVSCLLLTGEALAATDTVLFCNPDMAFSDPRPAAAAAAAAARRFVLVGRRANYGVAGACAAAAAAGRDPDLSPRAVAALALGEANDRFVDYFLFSRGALPLASMPPFLIGVWRWDSWLLGEALRRNGSLVADASAAVAAAHLGDSPDQRGRPGAGHNNDLFHASSSRHWPANLGRLAAVPARLVPVGRGGGGGRAAAGVRLEVNATAAAELEAHRREAARRAAARAAQTAADLAKRRQRAVVR